MGNLALAVILIRMVLSEQSTGAVGFMQMLNMSYQQMHTLYVVMLAGAIAGLVVSALTINPAHLLMPLVISLALMATGSVMDSFSSNLTRPQNLYVSQFLLGRNLLKLMLGEQLQLPEPVWARLSLAWVAFFTVMGIINLWVAYSFSTDTWVNFKLFGGIGLMLLFTLAQGLYISRHLPEEDAAAAKDQP